jgi:hypothetical protein
LSKGKIVTKRTTIAEALKAEMIKTASINAWCGDPDLLLAAYEIAGGSIKHPLDRIEAVIAAARRSNLFTQRGYIRASDSRGLREVLHPVFIIS